MREKLRSAPRKLWGVIGGSILACCLCLVVLVVVSADSTEESELASRGEGIELESADSEAELENEVSEPSATAEDTAVPEPSPTATATASRTPEPTATAVPLETPTEEPTEPAIEVAASVPEGELAIVVEIVDGDTIKVLLDGERFSVRYIGMDTPERGSKFFAEAMEANQQLVEGQQVILVKDVSETDRYG